MIMLNRFRHLERPCSTVKASPLVMTTHLSRSVVHVHVPGGSAKLRSSISAAKGQPSPYQPNESGSDEIARTSPSSTGRVSSNQESPFQDAAEAAVEAAEDTSKNTIAGINQAADAATAIVTDASDVATALISDTAQAATGAVSDAYDAASALANDTAQAASTAVSDVADAISAVTRDAEAAADQLLSAEQSPGVDFGTAGSEFDSRFGGMKVLVTGATGALGRRVVQALRSKGVACRALVRDTARAANLLPIPTSSTSGTGAPAFEVIKGDVYQYATLPAAVSGCSAVIVCTAANDKADPFGPFNIDYQGTLNLIAAAKREGVKRFVFVTSIGADDPFNPLNLFWGILFWKKRAEEELQRSGLSYTIIRPGGLKNELAAGESEGNIVMKGPDSFGFPPFKESGSILRTQVADVCVEALVCNEAVDKVVEIIAQPSAPAYTLQQLFQRV